MKICVFDTETTGFPVRDGKLDQQPYIIQFAAIMGEFNTETKEYEEKERYNILIKPKIAIPFASSQVHGIYDRDVADKQYISEHIDTIIQILNRADIVAGHNVSFDEEVLGFELARLGRVGDYTPIKTICTMRGSTEYCKLQ